MQLGPKPKPTPPHPIKRKSRKTKKKEKKNPKKKKIYYLKTCFDAIKKKIKFKLVMYGYVGGDFAPFNKKIKICRCVILQSR